MQYTYFYSQSGCSKFNIGGSLWVDLIIIDHVSKLEIGDPIFDGRNLLPSLATEPHVKYQEEFGFKKVIPIQGQPKSLLSACNTFKVEILNVNHDIKKKLDRELQELRNMLQKDVSAKLDNIEIEDDSDDLCHWEPTNFELAEQRLTQESQYFNLVQEKNKQLQHFMEENSDKGFIHWKTIALL